MQCSLMDGSFVVLARQRYEDTYLQSRSSSSRTSDKLNASGYHVVIAFDCKKSHIVVITREFSSALHQAHHRVHMKTFSSS